MGHMSAVDMVAHASQDNALRWHLQANHYPPLPSSLLPVAKRVIQKAKRRDWDARVRLPKGILWKGKTTAPVSACVEAWHLDAFLEQEDQGGEDSDF
jgi:hypothetical protein